MRAISAAALPLHSVMELQPRRRPNLRHAVVGAASLGLGVAASMLIAWICVQFRLNGVGNQPLSPEIQAAWSLHAKPGWPAVADYRHTAQSVGYSYQALSGSIHWPTDESDALRDKAAPWAKGIFKESCAGWPFKCLKGHSWLGMNKGTPTGTVFWSGNDGRGWFEVPALGYFKILPSRRLPIMPVWSGLVLNSLLFAVPFWVLIRLPSQMRRRLRRIRGRCPGCGYPVGTSDVCTECGGLLNRLLTPSMRKTSSISWRSSLPVADSGT